MKKQLQTKLAELDNSVNNKKRKSTGNALLLFIAQMTAETNGNIKWLIWIAGLACAAAIALLVALAIRGL
ncbi:hypothetical protein ES703_50311 [subsurface metagenome]